MRLARIACLDLDTFFVSVERLLDPTLRGRAVVSPGRVTRVARRGVGAARFAREEGRDRGAMVGSEV